MHIVAVSPSSATATSATSQTFGDGKSEFHGFGVLPSEIVFLSAHNELSVSFKLYYTCARSIRIVWCLRFSTSCNRQGPKCQKVHTPTLVVKNENLVLLDSRNHRGHRVNMYRIVSVAGTKQVSRDALGAGTPAVALAVCLIAWLLGIESSGRMVGRVYLVLVLVWYRWWISMLRSLSLLSIGQP